MRILACVAAAGAMIGCAERALAQQETAASAGGLRCEPSQDAAPPTSLEGTWLLVEISPRPVDDLPPFGQSNWKEHYADGKLVVIEPDETLAQTKPEEAFPYAFDGQTRTLTFPDGEERKTPVDFLPGSRMKLTHGPGNEWTYVRLAGGRPFDCELEPISLARVRMSSSKSAAPAKSVSYDGADYSALPPEQRVQGIWERIAVAGFVDMPPFGFMNDVFVFRSDEICVEEADGKPDPKPICTKVRVQGNKVSIPGAGSGESPFEIGIAFDRWQHLELTFPESETPKKMVFRRVTKQTSPMPRLPLTIVRALR